MNTHKTRVDGASAGTESQRTENVKDNKTSEELNQEIGKIQNQIGQFFMPDSKLSSLPKVDKVEQLINSLLDKVRAGTSSKFDGTTQNERALIRLLSVLDQNAVTTDAYSSQIKEIEQEIQNNKSEYFTKQKEKVTEYSQNNNRHLSVENGSARTKVTVKRSRVETYGSSHKTKPTTISTVEESDGLMPKKEQRFSAPEFEKNARRAVIVEEPRMEEGIDYSFTREAHVSNKTLELRDTVQDGNCGADALQKALSELYSRNNTVGVNIPKDASNMRRTVATTCNNVRQFFNTLNAEIFDIDDVLDSFKKCFNGFLEFKSVVDLSNDSTLKDAVAGTRNWNEFNSKAKSYSSDNIIMILKSINGIFPVSFTGDAGVLGGDDRNDITGDTYLNKIGREKFYLDLQEVKTTLLSYGFVETEQGRSSHFEGTIFEFTNSEGKSLYFFLNRFKLDNNQAMGVRGGVNSHWQYLTPLDVVE